MNEYHKTTLTNYAFGCYVEVVFARNLYNNVVVYEAHYINSDGGVIYSYYDDKNKRSTIAVKNLDIPPIAWEVAEKSIALHVTYCKLREAYRIGYSAIDNIWGDLIGLHIKSVEFNDGTAALLITDADSIFFTKRPILAGKFDDTKITHIECLQYQVDKAVVKIFTSINQFNHCGEFVG